MQQKKNFIGGIDSDTTNELLPLGRDRYRLNVRALSSDNSTIGAIETVNGNTLVTYSLPNGTNKTIGSAEYKIQKKIYYFVWNSANNHSILEYDAQLNTISKVLQSSLLNFNEFKYITSINFIELDVDNHLMYWTDNYNEPRKINIEKGKYYSAGNFTLGYKNPLDARILYRIKQPPLFCPEYSWTNPPNAIQFTAYEIASQIIPYNIATTIHFDAVSYNPAGDFDISTYTWTVGSTGVYNIHTIIELQGVMPIPPTDFTILIKNGGGIITSVSFVGITTTGNQTVDANNVFLTAGDLITVQVLNTTKVAGVGISIPMQGITFEASLIGLATVPVINNFFKRLFQFKCQFVYDDFEVSAWSPISDYSFPETLQDPQKTDDIIKQDSLINITVPTGSSIVTKIRIAAKEMTETDFSLIAELDKRVLLLSDNSTYVYPFTNDGNYVGLEVNESIKLYDSVPLLSQTHDIISGNRLADGLIKEGYDNVNIDMMLPVTYTDVTSSLINPHYPKKSYQKSGGIYNYGIVYYDYWGNRSGVTNSVDGKTTELQPDGTYGTRLYIPFLTESDYAPGAGTSLMDKVPVITANIYNSPPSWASHYQIVRSKNQNIAKYFQFTAKGVTYNGGTTNTITIDISNISGEYLTAYPNSILVYTFTKGDRIRFIAPRASSTNIGTPFAFNDSEVLKFDSGTGVLTIRNNFTAPSGMTAGVLFEIYTPAKTIVNDNEIMYEVCECNELSRDSYGNLIHEGDIDQLIVPSSSSTNSSPLIVAQVPSGHGLLVSDLVKIVGATYNVYGVISVSNATNVTIDYTGYTITGTYNTGVSNVVKAASVEMQSGDCFRRVQDNIYSSSNTLQIYVEASNVSNMFISNAWDYGRPNRIDKNYKQITRPSTIYYSEKFIPDTFINGLSSVFDTNFETYRDVYGGIYKLYAEDQTLIMFQELKISLIPVSQVIYNDLQGGNTVGASSQVLSPQPIYYAGEYGIGKNSESFAVYGKSKYGIDVRRGVVWRLSIDGLTPISDTSFMHNYFTDRCQGILSQNFFVPVWGGYDVKFNEYLISFPELLGNSAETVAFNEKANQWSTFYSYLPETICSNGINIVSFYRGRLYTHNTNSVQANFYGFQYYAEIWPILNDNPSNVKICEAVSEETNEAWEVYSITTPNGQSTNLIVSDFQEKENLQYAPLWQDVNTPNVVNPLINGDPLRDTTFLFKFRRTLTTYNKIFAVNFNYIISNLHNR